MENEFGYFSKDVAIELNITTSTLRRWSIELEKEGYNFHRNEKEQRIYYERDFKAFRELKKFLSNSVPFTDAIKAIALRNFEGENAERTPSVYPEIVRLSKHELHEIVHVAVKKAIEEERETMFQAFENKMNDVVEKRDRIITQQMKQTLEKKHEQHLLEIAATQEGKKLSWWSKLFKNKGGGESSEKRR